MIMKKRSLILILALTLAISMAVMTGCGGSGSGSSSGSGDTPDDYEFLLGSWVAESATYDGEERPPEDVFGGTFQLYFDDDGECTMSIDSNDTVLKWTPTQDGVLLSGDDTYEVRFPNGSKSTLIVNVNDVDVLMTKYKE